ncbi:Protein R05G6.1 [Aphelenchoides avenae]|nr:Protein R05G6.1 [Aphelenchus avenae]
MRKASVSAQLTRTARRFSTVIAPQLTKLETTPVLQKFARLTIRISDIKQLQNALKEYVLHNAVRFDPIEFDIFDETSDQTVLKAQFYAEEVVLLDGAKRVLSIALTDPDSGVEHATTAKIRHPLSGIKVFEFVDTQKHGCWNVVGSMDESHKCTVNSHSNFWRHLLSTCGMTFAPEWWSFEREGVRIGQVTPQGSLCDENSIRVEWQDDADNEMRQLLLSFGLVQTVREAFPSLLHIVQESSKRRGHY